MSTALARRLAKLEAQSKQQHVRRWHAAIDRLVATMDPEHAQFVHDWLEEHINGKLLGGPCDDGQRHVCPQCVDRLNPPALPRAVWLMLLDHTFGSGAPVAMPPEVADIYLNDPDAYPLDPCEGCGYLMPMRCTFSPDGRYRPLATYVGACPVCGQESQPNEEGAG